MKAVNIMTKHFPVEIINKIKVVFYGEENYKDEFDVLLIHGSSDNISKMKIKF